MFLKDVVVGRTYEMGFSVFTVAAVRVASPGVVIETTGDKVSGVPATRFSRPALTMVSEVK